MFNTTEKFKFKKACFELLGIYDDEVDLLELKININD